MSERLDNSHGHDHSVKEHEPADGDEGAPNERDVIVRNGPDPSNIPSNEGGEK